MKSDRRVQELSRLLSIPNPKTPDQIAMVEELTVRLVTERGSQRDEAMALNAMLLDALRACLFFVPIGTKAHDAADAAIAKAQGGEK